MTASYSAIFWGCQFFGKRSEEKNRCAVGESGGRCKSSPVAFRGETRKMLAILHSESAQNIALVALRQQTVTKGYTRNLHF